MGRIVITAAAWKAEERIAEQSLATTGHLPEGNQVGARFWSLVGAHYNQAVATDNVPRFLRWHGPVITTWEEQNLLTPLVVHLTPVVPAPPAPMPGHSIGATHHQEPPPSGGGGSSVPEPPSFALIGIGLIIAWLIRPVFRRRDS